MLGRPIVGRRWVIEKEAVCIRCRKGAMQLIEITPSEALVICTNCMAERHYLIHGIEPHCRPQFHGSDTTGFRNGSWDFRYTDHCIKCGNCVDNEVNVDERRVKTVCPACCYTRLYEFDMLNEPRGRR